MATAAPTRPDVIRKKMTVQEFLALPYEPGVERMYIKGEMREYHDPVSYRNRHHGRAMTRTAKHLDNWLDAQPEPRGEVFSGDTGVLFDTGEGFGIDVLYVSAEVMARQTDEESTVVVGVPELVVEILSPSDSPDRYFDKVDACLDAGVKLVWVMEPRYRTITVYRPGQDPVLFSGRQDVTDPVVLPGFRVPAADLFG